MVADPPFTASRVVVLDLETTGTDPAADRIIEIGTAVFLGGRPSEWRRSRVDPGVPIPPDATAVHGIGDADVAGQPTLGGLAPRLLAHLQADGGVLVGYNARRFDVPLLNAELARAGRAERVDPDRVLDLMIFARWYHRDRRRRRLADLCAWYGIALEDAHAAAADSAATGFLLFAMINDGVVPPTVQAAFAEQRRLLPLLAEERRRWGWWIYPDRLTGELCVGNGPLAGLPLAAADAEWLSEVLATEPDLPPAARAAFEARLRGVPPPTEAPG